MAKCGKGCMPECQYFTTSGCISPFNCSYKIEENYSNSATSTPNYYLGSSYTDAPADEYEPGIKKWYREAIGLEPANYDAAALKAYISYLESENYKSKQRLKKSIYSPVTLYDEVWDKNGKKFEVTELRFHGTNVFLYCTNKATGETAYFDGEDIGDEWFTTEEACQQHKRAWGLDKAPEPDAAIKPTKIKGDRE